MPKKLPRCSICKKAPGKWTVAGSLKRYCGPECGAILALELKAKKDQARLKATRREHRRQKENIRTRSDWIKLVQIAFNECVRLMDICEPCASCGKFDHQIENPPFGVKWHAGHFRSRGAAPQLRFHPMNCYRQCLYCNLGSSQINKNPAHTETIAKQYEVRLRDRFDDYAVEEILNNNDIAKWSIEELKDMLTYYRKLNNSMRKYYRNKGVL